jgi:hypothetical protein
MANERVLAIIGRELMISYVRNDRERSKRHVRAVRLVDYAATGHYRVAIQAQEPVGAKGPLKTFLVHRIVELTDLTTGECTKDVAGYLALLVAEVGGRQPQRWPCAAEDPYRTTHIDISFDAAGYAVGWAFGVHQAFRDALDIRWEMSADRKRSVWTRGVPPHYEFGVGDVFHSPFPFGKETRFTLQVIEQDDAFVTVTVADRVANTRHNRRMTQDELAGVLRNGLDAGGGDDHAADASVLVAADG